MCITLVLCGIWVGFSTNRDSWHFHEILFLLSPILSDFKDSFGANYQILTFMKTPHHMSWFYSCMWNLKCGFIKINSHFGVWNFTCKVEIIISKTNTICTWFYLKKIKCLAVIRWKMFYSSTGFSLKSISSRSQVVVNSIVFLASTFISLFNQYFKTEGFPPSLSLFYSFQKLKHPL